MSLLTTADRLSDVLRWLTRGPLVALAVGVALMSPPAAAQEDEGEPAPPTPGIRHVVRPHGSGDAPAPEESDTIKPEAAPAPTSAPRAEPEAPPPSSPKASAAPKRRPQPAAQAKPAAKPAKPTKTAKAVKPKKAKPAKKKKSGGKTRAGAA